MTASFIPRQSFSFSGSIPRSYYLGHHRAGLSKMKQMLSTIDYVLECRDYRVPGVSRNPMFEEALGDKRRLIVYTREDLGLSPSASERKLVKDKIRSLDPGSTIFFVGSSLREGLLPMDKRSPYRQDVSPVIRYLDQDTARLDKLVGSRVMVVGMPNVGKSTLINNLRHQGALKKIGKTRAAQTGAQPGITRKVSTEMKIIERDSGAHVYVLDTPGVFVPYVHDGETMLKLALCGSVKDAIISPIMLADYLLFHINLHDTGIYEQWSPPTNDIMALLDAFARQRGVLAKGGAPNLDLAAAHFIEIWRKGHLGRFILDDLEAEERRRQELSEEPVPMSMTQALKAQRLARRKNYDTQDKSNE